ncbi:pre-rRNA-processing protein esf1 [Desmophyllum pertusum]|uniref:Pre-rRNA-processing protein esf1 n=1 Tax=Desmophyllum pertusum TaxID=174260 RepID=A0A9W9ZEY2_9CNID|nr:pre-rRNA-processing protein esf1 [Desmophyllum pertusum]
MEADQRFARVAQDPRFKKIPRKERKLKIDGRFQKMFTDQNFTTKYFVDKRGSKVEKTSTEDLHKFYEMSDESEKEEDEQELQIEKKIHQDSGGKHDVKSKARKEENIKKDSKKVKNKLIKKPHSDEDESADEITSNVKQTKQTKGRHKDGSHMSSEEEVDISRGEGDMQSSSDEEDEENLRLEINKEDIEHPWGEMDVSTKTTENASRRLAVCNLDWDRVTATDLFVLFNSFKPRDGVIESVKIYPSQYGLEQMGKEEYQGPVELKDDDSENEELADSKNTEGSEFSMEKLRQYQLNRLKYYYAVMECNSTATAEVLYEECDGTEF